MNPERWEEVRRIFLAALEQPAALRDDFVLDACGEDSDLATEVQKLIQASLRTPDGFMEPPPASGSLADLTGRVLGEHELLEPIGFGGMGVVWRARKSGSDQDVAIKVLPPSDLRPLRIERFRREVLAASKLRHPNIVGVLDHGHEDGLFWYTMELVEGGSLAEAIDACREDPVDAASQLGADLREASVVAELTEQIATGLAYAHDQQIVHRDIKPQNILIERGPVARIGDFGLAKDLDLESLTQSGEVRGTPHYMSPEQAAAARDQVDQRTDIYSTGAVLYELLTRQRLFEGATTEEIFYKITHTDPRPIGRINPRAPSKLSTICMKALRKRPQDRYPTARALAADLRAYLEGRPIVAKPPSLASRARRVVMNRRALLASVPVCLAAGLFVGTKCSNVRASTGRARIRLSRGPKRVAVKAALLDELAEAGAARSLGRVDLGESVDFDVKPGEYRFIIESDDGQRRELQRNVTRGEGIEVDVAFDSLDSGEMSVIRAGTHDVEFVVGVSAEGAPRWFKRRVESPAFAIDRRCVTNDEWEQFLRAERPQIVDAWRRNTADARAERASDWGDLPVTRVSWTLARSYAEWRGKRLPTLVEWERAMRGDDDAWFKAEIDKGLSAFNLDQPEFIAWQGRARSSMGAYVRYVQPAVQRPRGFGSHRMQHPVGNVKEWVATTSLELDDDGAIRPLTRRRLSKGAAWYYPRRLVTTKIFRRVLMKEARDSSPDVGFRCARTV